MRQRKGAFTLVELIVVISILAILATIGFISFQGYSLSSRNSARISDVKTISKALEFFKLQEGKFPDPTNHHEITFSGALAWKQGTYGRDTHATVAKVSEIPTDPLTKNEYAYSVTNSGQEYELGAILEGGGAIAGRIINQAHANSLYSSYIYGNYNGLISSVFVGDSVYLLGVPTLITTSESDITVQDIYTQQAFAVKNGKNLPSSYANNLPLGQSHTGATSFTSTVDPVLFSGSVQDLSGVIGKRNFGETIHTYYASSNISGEGRYAQLVSLDEDREYITFVNTLITAEIGDLSEDVVTLSDPDSYTPSTLSCHNPANIGTVGTEGECNGMLIVDRTMLLTAVSTTLGGDGTFALTGPDTNLYTFGDSAYNIFTGQVTDTSFLFLFSNFDADISYWDTSNVTNMGYMFSNSPFNQPVNFDTSNVTDMKYMFSYSTLFNQPVNFDTSSVTNMDGVFESATAFNQPVNFDTSNVTSMGEMFNSAESFNQPLNFDTSNVTNMGDMFNRALVFNQDLSGWCVPLIASEPSTFDDNTPAWNPKVGRQPVWGTCP